MIDGPVAITGASGHVGRALQRRLQALPNEVRPLGRADDWAAALQDAQVAVHLAGALHPVHGNSYEAANVDTARRLLAALEKSGVGRVVALSYVGASSTGSNEYLRSKGRAEEWIWRADRPSVILRCSYIVGPPDNPGPTPDALLQHAGHPVPVLGNGLQRMRPVFVGDVVEAIVRASLDHGAATGRFDLVGPDELTLDELVEIVNGGPVPERHIPAGVSRALGHVLPSFDPALVDVLLADSLPTGQPLATESFGLELHRLREVHPARVAA